MKISNEVNIKVNKNENGKVSSKNVPSLEGGKIYEGTFVRSENGKTYIEIDNKVVECVIEGQTENLNPGDQVSIEVIDKYQDMTFVKIVENQIADGKNIDNFVNIKTDIDNIVLSDIEDLMHQFKLPMTKNIEISIKNAIKNIFIINELIENNDKRTINLENAEIFNLKKNDISKIIINVNNDKNIENLKEDVKTKLVNLKEIENIKNENIKLNETSKVDNVDGKLEDIKLHSENIIDNELNKIGSKNSDKKVNVSAKEIKDDNMKLEVSKTELNIENNKKIELSNEFKMNMFDEVQKDELNTQNLNKEVEETQKNNELFQIDKKNIQFSVEKNIIIDEKINNMFKFTNQEFKNIIENTPLKELEEALVFLYKINPKADLGDLKDIIDWNKGKIEIFDMIENFNSKFDEFELDEKANKYLNKMNKLKSLVKNISVKSLFNESSFKELVNNQREMYSVYKKLLNQIKPTNEESKEWLDNQVKHIDLLKGIENQYAIVNANYQLEDLSYQMNFYSRTRQKQNSRIYTALMQLNTSHLGKVSVYVLQQKLNAEIHFYIEDDDIMNILQNSKKDLRKMLSEYLESINFGFHLKEKVPTPIELAYENASERLLNVRI